MIRSVLANHARGLLTWAYILHDEGDATPGWHVVLTFRTARSAAYCCTVADWFWLADECVRLVGWGRDAFIERCAYLLHATTPEKTPYDLSALQTSRDISRELNAYLERSGVRRRVLTASQACEQLTSGRLSLADVRQLAPTVMATNKRRLVECRRERLRQQLPSSRCPVLAIQGAPSATLLAAKAAAHALVGDSVYIARACSVEALEDYDGEDAIIWLIDDGALARRDRLLLKEAFEEYPEATWLREQVNIVIVPRKQYPYSPDMPMSISDIIKPGFTVVVGECDGGLDEWWLHRGFPARGGESAKCGFGESAFKEALGELYI